MSIQVLTFLHTGTDLDILVLESVVPGDLIDDLSHSDHFTLVVEDRHAQDAVCPVARPSVHLLVEPRIL